MIQLLIFLFQFTSGLYSLGFDTVQGGHVPMSSFQGKKILLVNIATASKYAGQLGELQQLHQLHSDSLVIIAIPANDFGNEAKNDAALQQYFTDSVAAGYYVARKTNVKGSNIHPVYGWLSNSSQNGAGQAIHISGDFQKILIDKNGKVCGMFSGMVSPLDAAVRSAIALPTFD